MQHQLRGSVVFVTTNGRHHQMSYISTLNKGSDVLVWERTNAGRELKTFRAPYYFYTENPEGTFKSMKGKKLIRHEFDSADAFHGTRNNYTSDGIKMYESDLMPDLRIISEHYYGLPAPVLNVTFFDIEVDYNKDVGFSSVRNPYAPISAIAMYHQYSSKFVVLAVPPPDSGYASGTVTSDFIEKLNEIAPLPSNRPIEVILFKTEKELLVKFLAEIQESDVLSGWNSDFFDMPYITKRIESVLGRQHLRKLSFEGADLPKYREVEIYNVKNITVDLSGRISADYLALFRKYEVADRQSFKLESVADDELPDLPKLKYKGSLHDLYRKDFIYFIRYNIRDTEILIGFEEKLGYMALSNEMFHLSGATFKHVTGTLKLAELAIMNYCHHDLGVIVPDAPPRGMAGVNNESIQGAYVLEPKVGVHNMVGSIDIKSLYPSSIRAINISPETLMGQFNEAVLACEEIAKGSLMTLTLVHEDNTSEEHPAEEWRKILKERKWAVSGFGTVFDQTTKGIIPAILEEWYATRKKYQKLKKEAEKSTQSDGNLSALDLNADPDRDGGIIGAQRSKREFAVEKSQRTKNNELAGYYDRLQYVYKIKLNSLYGALTNMFFRFYDLRMGESTTGTGRIILQHQCAKVNEVLTGIYDLKGEAVIYGDTDSTYFETFVDNKEQAVKIADLVASKVNASYQKFMQDTFLCNPEFDDKISADRELVSDRGIFVDKKRYILHIVDLEGKSIDKLKVMGLDTKKTTLPKEVSIKLNGFIERYLKGEEWDIIATDIVAYKDQLKNGNDVMAIGLPRGIKGIEEYTEKYRFGSDVRLPGHVAAAIHYNECLDRYNDKENVTIVTGMKIKVFYLTQTYGRFKSIALPTDIEAAPEWFIENFKVAMPAHIERLVDKPLENIIKAIGKCSPSHQSLLTDSLLEF